MKRFLAVTFVACLLLMPVAINVNADQRPIGSPPPQDQPLVREGDLAVQLVAALKLGNAENEEQAESILSSAGIAPRNGWIADYPATPAIIGEVKETAAGAAASGKLAMSVDDAVKNVDDVSTDLGLPISVARGRDAESRGVPGCEQYSGSVAGAGYYDEEGPPVVTYYAPPCDYSYLYAWVPYPFWWGGFGFAGFFILNDFDRIIVVKRVNKVVRKEVTNHVFDREGKNVRRVDPVTGATRDIESTTNQTAVQGRKNTEGRDGAAAIMRRSMERNDSGAGRGDTARGQALGRSGTSAGSGFTGRGGSSASSPSMHGGSGQFHGGGSHGSFGHGGGFSGGGSSHGGGFSGGGHGGGRSR